MQRELQLWGSAASCNPAPCSCTSPLLGASCQADPMLWRLSLLKASLVTWGHSWGRAAALTPLRRRELRHSTAPGTGQMSPSCPSSAAGQGAAQGLRTWSSARSQRVTQSAKVSQLAARTQGPKPGMQSLLMWHTNCPYLNSTNAPGSFLAQP